jgi:hypothetical protein
MIRKKMMETARRRATRRRMTRRSRRRRRRKNLEFRMRIMTMKIRNIQKVLQKDQISPFKLRSLGQNARGAAQPTPKVLRNGRW